MKRFHILLTGLALMTIGAVGYSDSHEIKKDSIQVSQEHSGYPELAIHTAFVAELPVTLVVDAPDLGHPASNHVEVSEELTSVFVIRVRPPPEKVQKSEYTDFFV